MNLITDPSPAAQSAAIQQSNDCTARAGLPSYTDLVDTIADMLDTIRAMWARVPTVEPASVGVMLTLQADEVAELREWLEAELLDLSTINVEDEDRPRIERMHRVLRKLGGA